MPLVVTMCRQVTWQGVGDVEKVRQILLPVAAIGKKRSQGEGRVLAWHVEPTDSDPWESGHLHADGSLGRPALPDCLANRQVPHGGSGVTGLRPPYRHPSRQHRLLLPAVSLG